jgi:folate-binding protein YgfZ
MNPDLYRRIIAGESAAALLSPRALWRLGGPDAERYLNGQVTNDVARLADGQGCYAAVCTAKGRMEGDVSIAKHDGAFYLDADATMRESLGARLDKYLIADDALFEDVSDEWNLRHVFGATAPAASANGFVIAYTRFGIAGHDVWTPASEIKFTELVADAEIVETLRIENAIPLWGAELTTNTLPPEAGPHMVQAISYTKGCYVGQETIARLKSVGHVNRLLVFLESGSKDFPAPGTKLKQGEAEVGVVTSSVFSPRLEKGIALGYCQYKLANTGTVLLAGELPMTISSPLDKRVS